MPEKNNHESQPTATESADAIPVPGGEHHPSTPRRRRARFWGTPPSDDGAVDVWLMSYADMVTLLMTVFVILVLMATVAGKGAGEGEGDGGFSGARGFLFNMFDLQAVSPYSEDSDFVVVAREGNHARLTPEQLSALAVIKTMDLDRIRKRQAGLESIREKLAQTRLGDYVKAEIEGDGIRINVPDPIIFNQGVDDIEERSMAVLRALVPILNTGDFLIVVEGHTDDSTPDSSRFASNWELSSGRAAVVVRFLIRAGVDPRRLEAAGFADTRPILDNKSEAARKENRRVSILLKF